MAAKRQTLTRIGLAMVIALVGIVSTIGSGGGGGGSSFRAGGAAGIPAIPITSNNAFDVASAVVQAVLLGFDTAEVGGGPVGPDPQQAPATAPASEDRPATLAVEVTRAKAGMLALEVAIGPITEPCDGDGTVTLSGDLANPPDLTVGDTLTFEFSNCDDGLGTVIDGQFDIVIREIVGDPATDVYLLTVDAEFTDLTVVEDTDTFSVSGDVTVTEDTLALPIIRLAVSGNQLETAAQGDVFTLFDFTQSLEADTGMIPDRKVVDALGTLASDLLGGKVDYVTALSIEASGDADPDTGEVPITGAEDSTVTIVILDSTTVRLDVDEDGDGVVDDEQFTTWAALSGENSTINTSTAPVVAAEVIAAFLGFPGSQVGSQFSPNQVYDQLAQLGVVGNFGPVQVPCPVSGDATISGVVAVAGTYSAGDQLDTTFNACERQARVLNGQLDVSVTSFQGMPGGAYRFEGTGVFTNFVESTGAGPLTSNGSLDNIYDVAITTPGNTETDSTAMVFEQSSNGTTRNLSNAVSSAAVDFSVAAPLPALLAPSGVLTTTALPGSYSYQTLVPLETLLDGDPTTFASVGNVLVTASDASSVQIVALDVLNARLDIDLDGDQFVDEQIFIPWADLLP